MQKYFHIGLTLIDLNQISLMKLSEFEYSLPVENLLKFVDAEKRIVSELSKISIPKFTSTVLKIEE